MKPRGPDWRRASPRLGAIEDSGHYSNFGPQESELRLRFAELFDADPECVRTACNATLALQGAVTVSGKKSWVLPSFTFSASPAAATLAGTEFIFGDIGQDWWLDTIPNRAEGVMPVAPFGDIPLTRLWSEHSVGVLDAAASLGSALGGLSAIPAGWAVVFSLHATKVLGSGEGAVVVFGSVEQSREFRAWTNFGFSGERVSKFVGTNAKMSELQAVFVHAALDDWETEKEDWNLARRSVGEIESELGIERRPGQDLAVNPYWIVTFPSSDVARAAEEQLKSDSIETRRWWGYGCHTMPAYFHVPTTGLSYTNEIAGRTLGLPFFRGFGDREKARIIESLEKVW